MLLTPPINICTKLLTKASNVATFTIPVTTAPPVTPAPLPVTLMAFTARAAGVTAQLTWQTASEHHNAYFAVERSTTGQEADFVAVGQVAGHGSVTTISIYRFSDPHAATSGPVVYYRLRQVDEDGTSTYSPVRAVTFAAPRGPLSLYPNPTAGPDVTVDLSPLSATVTYQVRLFDATGCLRRQWTLPGGRPQTLTLAAVAPGTYLLLVSGTQPDGAPLRHVWHFTKE